jgi:hypothetical protein
MQSPVDHAFPDVLSRPLTTGSKVTPELKVMVTNSRVVSCIGVASDPDQITQRIVPVDGKRAASPALATVKDVATSVIFPPSVDLAKLAFFNRILKLYPPMI